MLEDNNREQIYFGIGLATRSMNTGLPSWHSGMDWSVLHPIHQTAETQL